MKIENYEKLAVTDGRRTLLSIADAGLHAIDTKNVVRETLRIEGDKLVIGGQTKALADIGKLIVIAIGKCASEAAGEVEAVLGDRVNGGVVLDVKPGLVSNRLKLFVGTHPLPSDENLKASEAIVESLKGLTEKDLVIFIISGGGSTLLFLPEDRGNRDEVHIFQALTAAGATIQELNTVRKHISLVRGGYLAKYAYPAWVASLIFSDVPTNDISFIASGPTVKDGTTVEDAERVLSRFNILKECNIDKCGLIETPKEDKYFAKVTNILAVSNLRALDAMRAEAEKLGFKAEVRGGQLVGEASDVGKMIAEELHKAPSKTALLWGGETTVTIHGKGKGGRNLELSASTLRFVHDDSIPFHSIPSFQILSLASDGRDHGPYAGAICDATTKTAIEDMSLDAEIFRLQSDTYGLFEKVGNYLMTGDTGSNVSDLFIGLKL